MTVYAKIENGQLVTAYNGYNGVIGLADNVDLMLQNGFKPFDETLISKYFIGQAKIIDEVLVDITDTDEYKKEKLEKEKQTKLQKVYSASTKKYSEQNQTITIDLPVTLTDGKTETNVDSFKLLTVTSAGLILPVLTGMVILATQSNIPDMLATADGLFVKGLNTATNNVKLIAQIFAKFGEIQAKITAYQRTLEVQINACTTIEDLSKIQIDFDQF